MLALVGCSRLSLSTNFQTSDLHQLRDCVKTLEYPTRQCGDRSDSTYRNARQVVLPSPRVRGEGSAGERGEHPTGKRGRRLELKDPHTAVWGPPTAVGGSLQVQPTRSNLHGWASSFENPTHGSGWMSSGPIYMDWASNFENPTHGSGWIVQVRPSAHRYVLRSQPGLEDIHPLPWVGFWERLGLLM
jgi:hypothetical protein